MNTKKVSKIIAITIEILILPIRLLVALISVICKAIIADLNVKDEVKRILYESLLYVCSITDDIKKYVFSM